MHEVDPRTDFHFDIPKFQDELEQQSTFRSTSKESSLGRGVVREHEHLTSRQQTLLSCLS
jgi:hypothetical protein